MRALWLPTVLRNAGLTVHEVSGWKTRGADSWGPIRGITCHHTAGSRNSTDAGEIKVLVDGRAGLPGPIAQLYLSRDGDWHVIASGHCNHNKTGWGGPNKGYGNDSLLGVEAQHSGAGETWTAVQYDSYVRGVAALVNHQASGWDVSVARVAGHKEHQPGDKSDPTFNMDTFRARVATMTKELKEWDEMASQAEVQAAVEAGVRNVLNDPQRLSPAIVAARVHDRDGWGEMSDRSVWGRLFEGMMNVQKALTVFIAYETAEDLEEADGEDKRDVLLADIKEAAQRIEAVLTPPAPTTSHE